MMQQPEQDVKRQAAALALPRWAMRLRQLNNLNMLAALLLAVFVTFDRSLIGGLLYAGIFILGWLTVAVVGAAAASRGAMLGSILVAFVALLVLNLTLALWFIKGF